MNTGTPITETAIASLVERFYGIAGTAFATVLLRLLTRWQPIRGVSPFT